MADLSDDELLAELGVTVEPVKLRTYTSREERIIAGFEDIVRFVDEHGHAPLHGEELDIFERLYAVRLDRLRGLEECRELLTEMDKFGLLGEAQHEEAVQSGEIDDDDLLAQLGIEPTSEDDIRVLRHVPTADERRAADEIANREKCEEFEKFEPLFERVASDLKAGVRETRPFVKDSGFSKADITIGQFFIIGGQTAYVAAESEPFKAPNGQFDARLRIVFDNGTESNLLRRSMQRALYKDEAGRRISDGEAGPLFGSEAADEDSQSGTVYVLRSNSEHPMIAPNREVVHKIGVTGGDVVARIAGAKKDATYLLADVEIAAEYKLFNINRRRLEALLHRLFSAAQFEIELKDRFGNSVKPREWFLVPLEAIDEAISRVRDGSIVDYRYAPEQGRLIKIAS